MEALDAGGEQGLSGTATAVLLFGVFAIGSQSLLLSPVLKDVAASFGVEDSAAAYTLTAYGLSLAFCAPLVGLLSNILSRHLAIIIGLAGFAAALFWRIRSKGAVA